MTYSNGDIYEGEWGDIDHRWQDTASKHGKGKMIYENGHIYEGEWKDVRANSCELDSFKMPRELR